MNSHALDINTNPKLLTALREAVKRTPSDQEMLQQRISFIYGSVGNSGQITRAKIEAVLKQAGQVG